MNAQTHVTAALVALILCLAGVGQGACQGVGGLDLNELGLGDLAGMLNPQMLGALGGLGGMAGGLAPGAGSPTIIVSQPAMLVHGGCLYVAADGKVTKFDLDTLEKLAEATYGTPGPQKSTAVMQGTSRGPRLIGEDTSGAQKPPLVPGATPSTGP